MYTYIIACVVIVISHCSDPLSEAGFCQNYLDVSLVNGWPCSCRVALRLTAQRVPCGFCTRFFSLVCSACCAQHSCVSLCSSWQLITVFVADISCCWHSLTAVFAPVLEEASPYVTQAGSSILEHLLHQGFQCLAK